MSITMCLIATNGSQRLKEQHSCMSRKSTNTEHVLWSFHTDGDQASFLNLSGKVGFKIIQNSF